jgi:hypothetical protein
VSSRPGTTESEAQRDAALLRAQADSRADPRPPPPPSSKVLEEVQKKIGAQGNVDVVGEYNEVFTTRPKVPRTPMLPGH